MEIRLSLALLALLGGIAWSLAPTAPAATLQAGTESARELARLEDAFAVQHDNLDIARRLAAEYLRLGQPALAVGVVRTASPSLAADPLLTHRLAQAYEAVGRLDDALATASVAHARCLRAVGSAQATFADGPPDFVCTPAVLVALEQHEQALTQMLRWGVSDPRRDPRARLARGLAERRARIASIRE
jgi:tetratricopeptide (TPR) repeat protein